MVSVKFFGTNCEDELLHGRNKGKAADDSTRRAHTEQTVQDGEPEKKRTGNFVQYGMQRRKCAILIIADAVGGNAHQSDYAQANQHPNRKSDVSDDCDADAQNEQKIRRAVELSPGLAGLSELSCYGAI